MDAEGRRLRSTRDAPVGRGAYLSIKRPAARATARAFPSLLKPDLDRALKRDASLALGSGKADARSSTSPFRGKFERLTRRISRRTAEYRRSGRRQFVRRAWELSSTSDQARLDELEVRSRRRSGVGALAQRWSSTRGRTEGDLSYGLRRLVEFERHVTIWRRRWTRCSARRLGVARLKACPAVCASRSWRYERFTRRTTQPISTVSDQSRTRA